MAETQSRFTDSIENASDKACQSLLILRLSKCHSIQLQTSEWAYLTRRRSGQNVLTYLNVYKKKASIPLKNIPQVYSSLSADIVKSHIQSSYHYY